MDDLLRRSGGIAVATEPEPLFSKLSALMDDLLRRSGGIAVATEPEPSWT
jgi:uncharacterized protein YjeT (DUF2065 family)